MVKLVVTIISVIVSSKKGNHFLKSLLLAFANTCEILSLLSELTVFPTNCGLRITVSRYPSAHIWDLRLAGGSSRQAGGIHPLTSILAEKLSSKLPFLK